MPDLATISDVESAWRPLSAQETTRAAYLIGRASRAVRRRWPTVDARITEGDLGADDVADVVVALTVSALTGPGVVGARSWQVSAGTESRSVALTAGLDDMAFTAWMVEVFDGAATTALPGYAFPDTPTPARPDEAVSRTLTTSTVEA